MPRWVALLFAVVACTWAAVLVIAPLWPSPATALAYVVGSVVCHQLPERSFHLAGFQLPVCARCSGIYAGAAIVFLLTSFVGVRFEPDPGWSRRIVGGAALPTIATVLLEWSGAWRSSNALRAAAGVVLGAGVALVVTSALATLHYNQCALRRPIEPSRPPTHT